MPTATQNTTTHGSSPSTLQRLKKLQGEISGMEITIKGRSIRLSGSDVQALIKEMEATSEQREAQEELTTTEAADLLNVSRPHLVKLLKQGDIPHHKVGSHHRVYREDVLSYKRKQRERAEEALQALTDQAQELDMGYGS
jgi:excisionase family DNA binding protein